MYSIINLWSHEQRQKCNLKTKTNVTHCCLATVVTQLERTPVTSITILYRATSNTRFTWSSSPKAISHNEALQQDIVCHFFKIQQERFLFVYSLWLITLFKKLILRERERRVIASAHILNFDPAAKGNKGKVSTIYTKLGAYVVLTAMAR